MKLGASTILICAATLAVGCGGGESPPANSAESSASAKGASRPAPLVARKPEPHIVPPKGPPPKKHVISRDLERGTGAVAKTGDMLTIDFVGVYYEGGKLLASSWKLGEPFTFRLGGGQGNLGWEKTLQGMRVGGRRELILPAHLTSRYARPSEERSQIYVIDLRRVGPRASAPSQ
jgi:peptidylprolyl isomerase